MRVCVCLKMSFDGESMENNENLLAISYVLLRKCVYDVHTMFTIPIQSFDIGGQERTKKKRNSQF